MNRLSGFCVTIALLCACSVMPSENHSTSARSIPISSADDVQRTGDLSVELTLKDCFALALRNSEVLSLSREEIEKLQSKYDKVMASVLPNLHFKSTYTRQEELSSGSSAFTSTFVSPERTEHRFTLHQPIFSGLKELYALKAVNYQHRAKNEQMSHLRQMLFADVAQAFYMVLQTRDKLAASELSLRLSKDRSDELRSRQKVGMARMSEVLSVESQVSAIRAQVEGLKGSLVVAEEFLKIIIGKKELPNLVDSLKGKGGNNNPVDYYLAKAFRDRKDIGALKENISSAEEMVRVGRSGHFPSIGMDVNYYARRPSGFSEDINWDIMLTMDVPIFEGWENSAAVSEYYSDLRSAMLQYQKAVKQVEVDIRQEYSSLIYLQNQLDAYESQVESSLANYELLDAEYRHGVSTNLDVQTALDNLQKSKISYNQAMYDVKVSWIRLLLLSGHLPEEIE